MNLGMRKNRFVAAREPNGRIRREERSSTPTEVKRLRDAALRGMRDEEWGSELGRFFLTGLLSSSQYAAGKRWRAQASRYMATLGVFPIRSISEPASRTEPPDPESDEGRKQVERDVEAEEVFLEARAILIAAGIGPESAVRRLCEEDLSLVGYDGVRNARAGLSALADYYALTDGRKS